MEHLKLGICEDDITQLKYLKREIESYYKNINIDATIESFESAEELLFKYPDFLPFHCLLLDIGLKKMDGMNLAKKIRQKDKDMPIIFITGDKEYVFEGYKVGAARYLVKPYKNEDLKEALSFIGKLKEEHPAEEYVGFSYQGEYLKLNKSDIILAEVKGHYLYIRTKEKEYSYKGSMKQLREEWQELNVCMANRSVLVNILNVEKITRTECFMSDGSVISISRGCYQELNRAFTEYYF